MDESAVGTQFDFGETNNVAAGIRTINLEHPIIYAHNNKACFDSSRVVVLVSSSFFFFRVFSLRWLRPWSERSWRLQKGATPCGSIILTHREAEFHNLPPCGSKIRDKPAGSGGLPPERMAFRAGQVGRRCFPDERIGVPF